MAQEEAREAQLGEQCGFTSGRAVISAERGNKRALLLLFVRKCELEPGE